MNLKALLYSLILLFSTVSDAQEKLKNFNLPVYNKEKNLSLDDIKADKIVINFFASWCTACMKEVGELNQLKAEYDKTKDIVFLAINAGEKDFKITKFLDKTKFDYLILKDDDLSYSMSIGVEKLPRTIVLNSKKEIIYSSELPPSVSFLD